jgi:GntR family transcriptional regulator
MLNISIATGSVVPIYRQVVDQVCRAVAAGGLKPDDRLPSVRELAEELVLNPNTIARAYGELVREGVAESRQGRGVFITERRQVYADPERQRRLQAAIDSLVNEALFLGIEPHEVRDALDRRLRDLQPTAGRRSTHHQARRS